MKPTRFGVILTTLTILPALIMAWLFIAAPGNAKTALTFFLNETPATPTAGDTVTVSVVAPNFNTASTTFTWYRNGEVIPGVSGLGKSSLTISTDPTQREIFEISVAADAGPLFDIGKQSIGVATIPSISTQLQGIQELTSNFDFAASNQNPDPGETVTIQVTSFSFDMARAQYQWSRDGAVEKDASGTGRSTFALTAGKEGTAKTVGVRVTTADGQSRSKSMIIRTASTSFYWWTDSVIPYWYKGKALPSLKSRVTLLATPNVANAGALNYQWQFNSNIAASASGVGKSSFTFTLGFPVQERIDVTMKDAAGSFQKTAGIGIAPVSPLVGIYQVKPLRGVAFEELLSVFSAPAGDPYNFQASPFFFPQSRLANLQYQWALNGQTITGTFDKPWIFILKSKANEQSTNTISLSVQDPALNANTVNASLMVNLH